VPRSSASGRPSRRRVVASLALIALALCFGARSSRAQTAGVPAELQAQLLSKLSVYDRNFAARAGDVALVLILVKSGSAKSTRSGATIKAALAQLDRFGGLRHEEQVVPFESAAALASLCRSKRAAVVYVTPGLDNEIDAIKSSLAGVDVLSVAAVPEYVPRGIVVGFEVVSGKPKLSIHIGQARQQRVDFKADVLKLMKVYR